MKSAKKQVLEKVEFYREEWEHGDGWSTLVHIHDYTTSISSISPTGLTMKNVVFEHKGGKVFEHEKGKVFEHKGGKVFVVS